MESEQHEEYRVQSSGDRGVIFIEGDVDDEVAGEALRKSFNKLFDSGRRTVILDLSKVDIINSYGIGKILMCHKRLEAEGGTLMVRPLTGIVKEIFELLMLDTRFPVDNSDISTGE